MEIGYSTFATGRVGQTVWAAARLLSGVTMCSPIGVSINSNIFLARLMLAPSYPKTEPTSRRSCSAALALGPYYRALAVTSMARSLLPYLDGIPFNANSCPRLGSRELRVPAEDTFRNPPCGDFPKRYFPVTKMILSHKSFRISRACWLCTVFAGGLTALAKIQPHG